MSKNKRPHTPLPERQADEIIQKFRLEADAVGKLDDYLQQFVGLKVKTMEGPTVYIESITGNKWKPTRYVINNEFNVVILDFHRQMLKDNSITDEMVYLFDQIEHEVVTPTDTERAGLIDPFQKKNPFLTPEAAIQSIRRSLN